MAEVSVNIFGLSRMCRLCLSRDVGTLDIFTFSDRFMNKIVDVIMNCTPVQITRCDEIPNLICQSCYTQLEKSHLFQKQVIQSDKTLQRYLQQLRITNKQIKAEWSFQMPSEHPSIHNTNTNFTMKCESLELQNLFKMDVNLKEKMPANYTSAYSISEEMFSKSEIKESSIDDSLYPTECITDLDNSSGGDNGIEVKYENSEIELHSENFTDVRFANAAGYFAKCEDKTKNTLSKLKKHEKTSKTKYKCDICNKYFGQMFVLNKHRRIHTGEKPYQCDVCSKCFSNSNSFKKHQRTHTGEASYKCKICKMIFTSVSSLKTHKYVHTGERPYKCDVCDKSFKTPVKLKTHQRIHTGEKPYQCDVCGKCLSKSGALSIHRRIHTGEKPFKCSICSKRFIAITNLHIHNRVHTGEKPYQCDVCSRCFSGLGSLRRHQRVHTGEKPYPCDVCDKSFRQPEMLRDHQRVHTGEKPYQCYECDKRFSRMQHLKTHFKGVHKKFMIYKCTNCEETFKMKRDLNWHIENVHNIPK